MTDPTWKGPAPGYPLHQLLQGPAPSGPLKPSASASPPISPAELKSSVALHKPTLDASVTEVPTHNAPDARLLFATAGVIVIVGVVVASHLSTVGTPTSNVAATSPATAATLSCPQSLVHLK